MLDAGFSRVPDFVESCLCLLGAREKLPPSWLVNVNIKPPLLVKLPSISLCGRTKRLPSIIMCPTASKLSSSSSSESLTV